MSTRDDLTFLAPPGEVADWRKVLLYDAATEAGVLSALPGTPADVAAAKGLDAHATTVVLEALAVWDIVRKDSDGRYTSGTAAPSEDVAALLRHHARSLRMWARELGDRLDGVDQTERSPRLLDLERWLAALAAYARPAADAVVDACLRRFPHAHRVLDLGGGHGEHALAFASRGLQVTMQDRPEVVDLATQHGRLPEAGVELLAGDFPDKLPEPAFDVVFSSAVTETYDASWNAALYPRLRPVIAQGGGITLLAFVRGRNDIVPAFAVQMLAAGRGGDTHSEEDYRGWLQNAGYQGIDLIDVDGRSQSLILADR